MVITAAFSSTTATQPAVARFRYLFRCSSRLPWRLSVEYTLPMYPVMSAQEISYFFQGAPRQRRPCFLLAQQEDKRVGRVAGDGQRPGLMGCPGHRRA